MDGDYLCDGGAERLIQEWKVRRGKWIDERSGVEQEVGDPAFKNLLQNAGSSTFISQDIPHIDGHERFLLRHVLAPFESDGEGDTHEWNLFDTYLTTPNNEESLNKQHDLSDVLQRWEHDKVWIMRSPQHHLAPSSSLPIPLFKTLYQSDSPRNHYYLFGTTRASRWKWQLY